jgi:hypothetical protein
MREGKLVSRRLSAPRVTVCTRTVCGSQTEISSHKVARVLMQRREKDEDLLPFPALTPFF